MRRTVNTPGFTLLELLIAISIFGMVIGIAYSSYNASFSIISDTGKSAKTYASAKTAMERIMADLESLHIGTDFLFVGSSAEISGHRADTLEFTSTGYVRLHENDTLPGHLIVRYVVVEEQNSSALRLYRSQNTKEADEETVIQSRLLLCDNLQEVAFIYHDKDGEEREDWGEEESDNSAPPLPALITIRLRFNDGGVDEPGTLFTSALTLPMAETE